MPLKCRPIRHLAPSGEVVTGFACGRASRCCNCGKPATRLCDRELGGTSRGKTCDRPLCAGCAVSMGPNRDYCPAHARAAQPVGA